MEENNAAVIERLTRLTAGPLPRAEAIASLFVVQDAEGNPHTVDLEQFAARPRHLVETFAATSVAGFIDYINRHKGAGAPVIFFDPTTQSFEAVIDYHDAAGPQHARHIATFGVPQTTAFKAWHASNNKGMTQEDFALFIEANMADIIEPSGSKMMEVATGLRALKKVEFQSEVNLDNGSLVFAFKEDVKGTFRDGTTEVPSTFKVGLPIFRGLKNAEGKEVAYSIEAKLRYRIKDGTLVLWYALPAIDRALEKAVEDVANAIAAGTSVQVIEGKRVKAGR